MKNFVGKNSQKYRRIQKKMAKYRRKIQYNKARNIGDRGNTGSVGGWHF